MIVFNTVSVHYENTCVLNNISVRLASKRIAIIGANGSGKSTFARVACGLIPISSGTILIHDIPIEKYKRTLWRSVNLTFQIPDHQIIMPNVSEELEFGLKHLYKDNHIIQQKVDYALSILEVKSTCSCNSLSAGKKRMLCLLSILLLEPRTIFLDEPTTFLDAPSEKYLMNFLETLEQQIIFITQNTLIAKRFEEALCIHNSSVYHFGASNETIKKYKALW